MIWSGEALRSKRSCALEVSGAPGGASATDCNSILQLHVARCCWQSVFGEARPREKIIAEKLGVDETELIKEQASKDFALNLRLTKAQLEQKEAAMADVASAKEKLGQNEDPNVQAELQAELESKESILAELLKSFEVRAHVRCAQTFSTPRELALKQAKEGGIRRDRAAEAEIKKQQALAAQARAAGTFTHSRNYRVYIRSLYF
eukprot:7922166-Pyramimonas_sp.AAC.2